MLLIFSFTEFAQVNFIAYNTSNSILTTNKIDNLVKDKYGDILVGTSAGLFWNPIYKNTCRVIIDAREMLPSDIYLVRLNSNYLSKTMKIVLLK